MDSAKKRINVDQPFVSFWHITFGYIASCAIAALMFSFLIIIDNKRSWSGPNVDPLELILRFFTGLGGLSLTMVIFALPAFVLARVLLLVFARWDWFSFSLAGTFCATLVLLLQIIGLEELLRGSWMPDPMTMASLMVIGAISGVCSYVVEYFLARRSHRKAQGS